MTAAAAKLGVAQQALGQQIRLLERHLDLVLLNRHSRGVTPTQAGVLLHERAQRILEEVANTERDLRRVGHDAHDHLVLGVNPSMVLMLGPDIFAQAQRDMPEVTLSLVEERSPVLLDALERGQINMAFLYNAIEHPRIERRAVMEEDLLLVSAPDERLRGTSVSLAEALQNELAIGGERGVIRQIVESEARRLSLKLRLAFEVHSVSSMKALVLRGMASSIMPASLAREELAAGTLMARRIDRPVLSRTLYLARPTGQLPFRQDAAIERFLARIVERCTAAMAPYARSLR